MVKLTFNAYGHSFQSGIDILLKSYTSAQEALENDVEQAADDAAAYQQAQDEGAEFIGERDDDGYVIWDQQDVLDHQHGMAQYANIALKRAYAIALYHHWERGALAWTGTTNAKQHDHDRLVKKVEALGMKVHAKVHVLRLVANLLKHNNDKWGKKVLDEGKGLIVGVNAFVPDTINWYEAVAISDQWMADFFVTVSASGPHVDTVWA